MFLLQQGETKFLVCSTYSSCTDSTVLLPGAFGDILEGWWLFI